MRLRPSGESGPIASSLAAFAQYQRESAWTWEHMALTRARPIAGDPALCERVAAAIRGGADPAARPGPAASPMSPTCGGASPRPIRRRRPWDLRNRRGGLIDLEFTVQYLLLREAAAHPELLHGDPAAAIAALGAAGALPPQAARELGEALSLLRHVRALLALLFDGVPDAAMLAGPAGATPSGTTLARCAGAIDFVRLEGDMTAACERVRFWYERLVAEPAGALDTARGGTRRGLGGRNPAGERRNEHRNRRQGSGFHDCRPTAAGR